MISAEDLAARHTSFWHATTPLLDGLVRTLNAHPRRYGPRMQSDRWSHRRAFIAEVAFAEFRSERGDRSTRQATLYAEARDRVAVLVGREPASLGALTHVERREARLLAERMESFFRRRARGQDVELDPNFRGCGVLSRAVGDVLLGDILYEVKAVGRTFRAIDIRQLLVYSALDYARSPRHVSRVGLYNPLQGMWEEWDLDDLCLAVAGLPANEVFHRVISYVTSDLDVQFDV